MATRFYILPIEQVGSARGPKYFAWRFDPDPPGLDVRWGMMDYGLMPTCLLATDVTTAQHNALVANSDVIGAPVNIDSQIGAGNITTVRNALEALRIPAQTAVASDTYRDVLRVVAGVFQFAQRYHGEYGKSIFDEVTTLNTTWAELSTDFQNELLATAATMNIDTSGLTANTTMRQILKRMADAWQGKNFLIGGFSL